MRSCLCHHRSLLLASLGNLTGCQEFIIREVDGAQAYLVEELFFSCTNERLFKISRQDDPPFYTASVRNPTFNLVCEDAWRSSLFDSACANWYIGSVCLLWSALAASAFAVVCREVRTQVACEHTVPLRRNHWSVPQVGVMLQQAA